MWVDVHNVGSVQVLRYVDLKKKKKTFLRGNMGMAATLMREERISKWMDGICEWLLTEYMRWLVFAFNGSFLWVGGSGCLISPTPLFFLTLLVMQVCTNIFIYILRCVCYLPIIQSKLYDVNKMCSQKLQQAFWAFCFQQLKVCFTRSEYQVCVPLCKCFFF